MTKYEYDSKVFAIQVSSAPVEMKQKALIDLAEQMGFASIVQEARKQIAESAPDISDIGGG